MDKPLVCLKTFTLVEKKYVYVSYKSININEKDSWKRRHLTLNLKGSPEFCEARKFLLRLWNIDFFLTEKVQPYPSTLIVKKNLNTTAV